MASKFEKPVIRIAPLNVYEVATKITHEANFISEHGAVPYSHLVTDRGCLRV